MTCTGELFMCLGQDDNADLRTVLRRKERKLLKRLFIMQLTVSLRVMILLLIEDQAQNQLQDI